MVEKHTRQWSREVSFKSSLILSSMLTPQSYPQLCWRLKCCGLSSFPVPIPRELSRSCFSPSYGIPLKYSLAYSHSYVSAPNTSTNTFYSFSWNLQWTYLSGSQKNSLATTHSHYILLKNREENRKQGIKCPPKKDKTRYQHLLELPSSQIWLLRHQCKNTSNNR